MPRGCFISLEGGEGVGKSTQLSALQQALERQGLRVIVTREPGGSEGAETIRKMLLDGEAGSWGPRAEALLFAAARADHVEKVIKPALERGDWVLSDRFHDSSRAYQGGGSGLNDDDILTLHRIGSEDFRPNLTLVLTLDEAESRQRARARDAGQGDRFEQRNDAFHAKVAMAFRAFAAAEPDRIKLVDASGPVEVVTARLMAQIEPLLRP